MINLKTLAILILIPFTPLTVYAVWDAGYIGLFEYQFGAAAGWQVLWDLVIALVLVLSWMIPHAHSVGRNPWPWVILTVTGGSMGPLLYLATSPEPVRIALPGRQESVPDAVT